VTVGALIALGLWFLWPVEEWAYMDRVFTVVYIIMPLTVLLVLLWWLFLSRVRWVLRLGVLLVLAVVTSGILFIVRDHVHFWGDMMPFFTLRARSVADDRLEAHRRNQGDTSALPPLVLPKEDPEGFPEFRGRLRDGVALGPPPARDWKSQPPRLLWRQPVGGGYGAFAVAGTVAVTLEQRRENEAVVCYDTATAKERWVYSYPALFKDVQGGDGPRSTPTIAGAEVLSLGATGRLVSLDLLTGRERWATDILQDNDNLTWGMAGSPLVYDRLVVVNPGAQRESAKGRALVAYDRDTGKEMWRAGRCSSGYSSPMLATLGGIRQILIFDGEGLGGHDSATGQELWRYPWTTQQGINVAQPTVLDGDRLLITSGYGMGCALLHISQKNGTWSAQPVWPGERSGAMRCQFSSPVAYQGFLYGLDDGILACIDLETGKRRWKGGRYGSGQLLRIGDLLLILTEQSGELVLVKATPAKHHELSRFKVLEGAKTWNTPSLAHGKAYLRNHEEMACYDLAERP
jgi:outer membrane protein assembly factor BamB